MKKKVLLVIAVIVLLLAAAAFYLNYRNRNLSPPGNVSLSNGDLSVSVTYSRPSVRGRTIFGQGDDALQPYGQYWRLGANESTEITFSKDVLFNGVNVAKGTYRMYAIPGESSFDIGLNTAIGKWGYSEPNYELDVLKTKVPVQKTSSITEQHTIRLAQTDSGIDVIIEWADVRLTIPVTGS